MSAEVCLGIHIGHDRGAALVCDGVLIGAISEERLDRTKHSPSPLIPFRSIDSLLRYHHLNIADVGCIAFSGASTHAENAAAHFADEFMSHYGAASIPFYSVDHHLAHAWSAYGCSGFEESYVLVADGGGDYVLDGVQAESLYRCKHGEVSLVEARYQDPPIGSCAKRNGHLFPYMPDYIRGKEISIGRKYEQITYLLGFGWGQAGKTMGLSPYGKPMPTIALTPDTGKGLAFSLTYQDILKEVDDDIRGQGGTYLRYLRDHSPDIAWLVQRYTEELVISVVRELVSEHRIEALCFAGGTFLNCVLNERILRACSQVKSHFFMPASGDDGQAIGCAFYGANKHFGVMPAVDGEFPFVGLRDSTEDVARALERHNATVSYSRLTKMELADAVAESIASGKVVGIVRGRTEVGPRALCHRSILASAKDPGMRDHLNRNVKHREDFRPFAPVVCAEDTTRFFEINGQSPYMLLAPSVREEFRGDLPSVTHVDGSARVQSVDRSSDPFIHDVLKRLEVRYGYPIAVNTSFNLAGEPVVETASDAISTFLRAEIDALVLDDFLVRRRSAR